MARRRPPASTPFGAWLARWFDDHPDWTVEGFAAEVHVSPAAVSLWLTKTKRVGQEHLLEVARVTGEDFDALWKMVYGQPAPSAAIPAASDLLDAVREAVRAAMHEQPATYGTLRAARPTEDVDELTRRRAYWLRIARADLDRTQAEIAKRIGRPVADIRAWEKGARIAEELWPAVAEGYELPLEVIANPPENDHHIVRSFRARWLSEQERVPLGQVVNDRRAS